MIVTSSSPNHHHVRSASLSRENTPPPSPSRKSHLFRRNTISDSRSILRKTKRSNRQLLNSRPTNLDCVLEQSDSFSGCSIQPEYIMDKNLCYVHQGIEQPSDSVLLPPATKAKTLPRSFLRKHPEVMAAWKGKQPTTSSAVPDSNGGESSWLETISTKISEKKRKSGIFGSLRGRNKKKETSPSSNNNNNNGGIDMTVVTGSAATTSVDPPKSPLATTSAHNISRKIQHSTPIASSHGEPFVITSAKNNILQMKPSFEFHSSTGFQSVDPSPPQQRIVTAVQSSINLTDSGVLEKKSCQTVVGGSSMRDNYKGRPPSAEVKGVAKVRKANSLPRNVLCSPVMSRRSKRNHDWPSHDFTTTTDDMYFIHSTSPPSSNMSSRIGSVDTLQPSINVSEEQGGGAVRTPTINDGWRSSRPELTHKISLTRSSSLPFEAEILSSEQSIGKGSSERGCGLVKDVHSTPSRIATRSQSFNTNYNSHSVVRKTTSFEEMKMRERVVSFLLETEQSYIHSLKVLAKDYCSVLSSNGLMEDLSVKELFIAVDELVALHQVFANNIEERLLKWSRNQMIGDMLLDMFTSNLLPNVYGRYIQHYSTARASIDHLRQSKQSLVRELEECHKFNHGRLDLKDLLIKPVQRIPRYMLFVKDIIKYTNHAHPDYILLQQSLNELADLAESVNETERESNRLQQYKELLSTVEGLSECLTSSSVLLRCDTVTEMKGSVQRKDRLLLLFSDVVVCAAIRRKSSGFRRGSLMNINSTQTTSETTRYQVKWCSQLSSLSVTRSQAPLFERRRYNTLEKLVHNCQKDEALLIQMMSLSSTLHCDHTHLNVLLQDMLDQLRSGMSNRQQEIEILPHDSGRLDLISHDCIPPAKYFLTFISQKERQQWEQTLRNAQLSSTPSTMGSVRNVTSTRTEENDYAPPSSPLMRRQSSVKSPLPKLLSHLSIPSCRVGAELSSVTTAVGADSSQLFITINDTCGRGSVAIISTADRSAPRLIATLPLSSTNLLCSACVLHPTSGGHGTEASFSLSDSGDVPFFNESTNFPNVPLSAAAVDGPHPPLSSNDSFDILRSSSAPPISRHMINNDAILNGWNHIPTATPPTSSEQWLWLGSEGGVVYLLKVGVSSLHVGTSVTFNLKSSVECLLFHNNKVWAGLRDGKLAVFKLQPDITFQYHSITNGSSPNPITCLAAAGHMILAATGNKVVGVSAFTECHKDQLELDIHHKIAGIAIGGQVVCLSLRDSMVIFICTFGKDGSLDLLCTMDCTNPVLSMLKNYDPIVKQHKCSFPHVTVMSCVDNALVIGTSTGVLVYLSLPLIPGHTPSPQPLVTGHVDIVSIVAIMAASTDNNHQLLITGGHGLEDILKGRLYNNVSETEGCVSLWELPINKQ